MDIAVNVTSQTDRLLSLVDDENPFWMDEAELLPKQLTAINEVFQDRIGKIKLLKNRAETGNITEIKSKADIVPLLFAHTVYKSYPEKWLFEGKWDRLCRWLDTVSTNRVPVFDPAGIKNLDDWLNRLGEAGHFVSCSSGTTGKCAMMNAIKEDNEFCGRGLTQAHLWAGMPPRKDKLMLSLGQVAATPRNAQSGKPMFEAIHNPELVPFIPDVPPITIGSITEMVLLRKKMADGTAKPTEIAYFEEQAAAREKQIESAVEQSADAIIASRDLRLHIMSLYAPMFKVADRVRSRGYSAKDFQENTAFVSGGLKRANLPPDYLDIIFGTLNLTQERICHAYGMQEINTTAIRCKHNRYHMAPWVMLLILDESGDNLIEPDENGEAEGRAAFFDLSMQGRWGGVISGDKVKASWKPCACGHRAPSVDVNIQRYADMASGDKITCSGTIDAYVRGVS